MDDDEGLPEPVRAWVQDIADRDFGGDFGRAAAVILEAAWQREQQPDNPWAEQESRLEKRRGV